MIAMQQSDAGGTRPRGPWPLRCAALVWLCLLVSTGVASSPSPQLWSLEISPGLWGQADYFEGRAGAPALLLLHGFLQTSTFSTVRRLAEGLAEEGLTVLVPTLSLGVSRRQGALPCDAVHTHTMEGDLTELGLWVDRLIALGHGDITLVGHSTGALQVAVFAHQQARPEVRRVVGISLATLEAKATAEEHAARRVRLAEGLAREPTALSSFHAIYCRGNYLSSAQAVGSYLVWDDARLLELLPDFPMPLVWVMGGEDVLAQPEWLERLGAWGAEVRRVPGANHFFGDHEFELQDAVIGVLGGSPKASAQPR